MSDFEDADTREITGAELAAKLGDNTQDNAIFMSMVADHLEETGDTSLSFEGLSPAGAGGVYFGMDCIWNKQIAPDMPEAANLPQMQRAFGDCANPTQVQQAYGLDSIFSLPENGR